jgi:hypothetical protein
METQTAQRVRAKGAAGPATAVAYAGAAAFVIAAAWFWLATKSVTVAPAPRMGPNVTPQQGMHIYYRWLVTTLPQERFTRQSRSPGSCAWPQPQSSSGTCWAATARPPGSARSRSAPAPSYGSPGASCSSEVTVPSA